MNKPVSDMYFAATLLACGREIVRVEKVTDDPKRKQFIFKDGPCNVWILDNNTVSKVEYADLTQLKLAHSCQKLMVSSDAMENGVRTVKKLLYSFRD